MRLKYTIEGTVTLPDGSMPLKGCANQYRLPSGKVVSVQPVIEMHSGEDFSDHRNLTQLEVYGHDIIFEDYDRTLVEEDAE